MAFEEQLPEWQNEGTQPPQSKRVEGWLPNEKPPASWFNWLFHRAYKALQELQQKTGQHITATTDVHGATSSATPNTLVQRDPAGRFKAGAPAAADDVARKAEVDGKVSKSGDTMTGPLDVRYSAIPAVIVRRENREDWVALAPPSSDPPGIPYSSKIVIKSGSVGQDPTEYEMVRFNSSPGSVGKQISLLTSNVERVRVEDSITTILNGLQVTGQIYRGTGSPEGSVSAPVGSIYHRADGGAGTALYVKEAGSGNTGWVAIGQSILTETGTFTPEFSDATGAVYTTQEGRYARFGNLVYFSIWVVLSQKGGLSGEVNIKGLPFVSTNTYISVSVGYYSGLNLPSPYSGVTAYVYPVSATVRLRKTRNTESSALVDTDMTNNAQFMVAGVYQI